MSGLTNDEYNVVSGAESSVNIGTEVSTLPPRFGRGRTRSFAQLRAK